MLWLLGHNSLSFEDCFHVFQYSLYIHFSNTQVMHVLICWTLSIHAWNTRQQLPTMEKHSCRKWHCPTSFLLHSVTYTNTCTVTLTRATKHWNMSCLFACGPTSLLCTPYFHSLSSIVQGGGSGSSEAAGSCGHVPGDCSCSPQDIEYWYKWWGQAAEGTTS